MSDGPGTPDEQELGRKGVLDAWAREEMEFPDGNYHLKRLTNLVMENEWLVTSIKVQTDDGEYFFVMMDPTCRQRKHYCDLEQYTLNLYYQFEGGTRV